MVSGATFQSKLGGGGAQMDCRICGSGSEWVGETKAVSLWIAPQLPDLERDKATA